jgi:citrate synthase
MNDTELNPGLEDIVVAETRLSAIDGDRGALIIGGYPLAEIAPNAAYEESVYLLLNDRLPAEDELHRFRSDLAQRRSISAEVASMIRQAAVEEHPAMDALRMGLSAARLQSDAEGERTTARRLVAVVPTLVAVYERYREGKPPVPPREDLGHAANYLYMLTGEEPPRDAVRGLETYLNTVIDHGLNASTFTARTVVSTESDLVSAATAAVGALKGPLHGGAPGPVLDMLQEVRENGDPEAYVRKTLAAGERLMGFGHRVYRARDPRAEVLAAAAERFYSQGGEEDFFETAREVERVGTRLLLKHKPDRPLKTNVEFYTAVLLHGIGIPRELFTATFAAARIGGWMAHALEQKRNNRLVRPMSRYDGDTGRMWTPARERTT